MTTERALAIIKAENEPLYVILKDILDKQERIEHSQVKLIEGILLNAIGTDPTKIDLSWLTDYLANK